MIRGMTLLWGALAIVGGVTLFFLKFEVQSLEEDLVSLNRQIRKDRQEIHVLHAEWAYLNNPARIRGLAERLLGMGVMQPEQVVAMAKLPIRPPPSDPTIAALYAEYDIQLPAPWKSYPRRKPLALSELASVGEAP